MKLLTERYEIEVYSEGGLTCLLLTSGMLIRVELKTDEAAALIAALEENLAASKRVLGR